VARLSRSQVLDEEKSRAVKLQMPIVAQGGFYLAGGTALALHLGHRLSRDLDWFRPAGFDAKRLTDALLQLPEKPTRVLPPQTDTVRVEYGKLETSFIRFSVVQPRPLTMDVNGVKLPVADLETIAVMKAHAVINRGHKRDLIDVHALARAPGWSMELFVDNAVTKGRLSPHQLRLGLTYFRDADTQEPPKGSTVKWEQVKAELMRDVHRAFDKQRGRGGLER
jgi:hypothetical protein